VTDDMMMLSELHLPQRPFQQSLNMAYEIITPSRVQFHSSK